MVLSEGEAGFCLQLGVFSCAATRMPTLLSRPGPASLRSSVSHSVLSEMQVIEQETPVSAKSSRSQLDLFDDVGTFASGPPK